jgi:hypothetical protein
LFHLCRAMNVYCLYLEGFDNHDIWHLLSSLALLLVGLGLLVFNLDQPPLPTNHQQVDSSSSSPSSDLALNEITEAPSMAALSVSPSVDPPTSGYSSQSMSGRPSSASIATMDEISKEVKSGTDRGTRVGTSVIHGLN